MNSIFIVDDDLQLCSALSEELTEIGFDTAFATSADEAIEYIVHHTDVDLMLLDLKMPEKDGFYVLEQLKTQSVKIKIIVLSAYADLSSITYSNHLGASDFITKPYDLDELIIAIRKVLYN